LDEPYDTWFWYYGNLRDEYLVQYGALYNYYVVADTSSLNVCPEGWHVPTDAEWTTLTTYLGGESVAGGEMKETGTFYWDSPNTGATNETDFAGLPGGNRYSDEVFDLIGKLGYWWSSTEFNVSSAWSRDLFHNNDNANKNYLSKGSGFRFVVSGIDNLFI
jgi:uncharacterized protein (TIGR02145 family)